MIKNFLTWSFAATFASCIVPVIVLICTLSQIGTPEWLLASAAGITLLISPLVYWVIRFCFKKFAPAVETESIKQAEFLDSIPVGKLWLAVLLTSALSLFLELVLIRWQATVFEFFAFYKNFSLLSCFAGLGLGYALARRSNIPLICTMPLLTWQIFFMTALRFGLTPGQMHSLLIMPFKEEQNIVYNSETLSLPNYIAIYSFLAVVFCLTALIFVPIGQLCGRVMTRLPALQAYGYNLLGSLVGVVCISLLSFFWTPPVVWFAIACAGLTYFARHDAVTLRTTAATAILSLIILVWPVALSYERIYSPYQLVERLAGQHSEQVIRASGTVYQRIFDLSRAEQNLLPSTKEKATYYDFAYKTPKKLDSVLIVGAGSGNDVAAAIRANAKHVVAVELDPAILGLGAKYHPEKPYENSHVEAIVNDARSFLNTTKENFDLIVFALLDSHVAQTSGLRVDSFVYTLESLKSARNHLKDGGILNLAFSVISPQMEHKIYMMMTEAFDGHPPICVYAGFAGAFIFVQSKEGDLTLPPHLLELSNFKDITAEARSDIATNVPTDDWPFFYMLKKAYPFSYLPMVALVLGLSAALFSSLYEEKPKLNAVSFFFLGAGFMLVETKAITELGLQFGNTWLVNAVVIAALMVMAFFSNLFVQKFQIKRPIIPFILLFISIVAGYMFTRTSLTVSGEMAKLVSVVVLTCPIFFSGIAFSCLLQVYEDISGAMFMNLMGAMLGGLLEYTAMCFGYRALYLLALAIYVLAYFASRYTKSAIKAA